MKGSKKSLAPLTDCRRNLVPAVFMILFIIFIFSAPILGVSDQLNRTQDNFSEPTLQDSAPSFAANRTDQLNRTQDNFSSQPADTPTAESPGSNVSMPANSSSGNTSVEHSISSNATVDTVNASTVGNVSGNNSSNAWTADDVAPEKNETVHNQNYSQPSQSEPSGVKSSRLMQMPAEVGQPVRWVRVLEVDGHDLIDLPIDSQDIQVTNPGEMQIEEAKGLGTLSGKRRFNVSAKKGVASVSYLTPAPFQEETTDGINKRIRIHSDASMHYYNVSAATEIYPTPKDDIAFYWIKDAKRVEAPDSLDLQYIDSDKDGLIERLEWVVPKLSEQNFEVLLNRMSFTVNSGVTSSTWSVLFEVGQSGTLRIRNLDPDMISYMELYSFDEGVWDTKDMVTSPRSSNGYTLTTYWNESLNVKGRIVFNVTKLGRFRLNMSLNGDSIVVANYYRYEQVRPILNIDDPVIDYRLRSFNNTYWNWYPITASSVLETVVTHAAEPYYLTIPRAATVQSASISVTSLFNTSVHSYGLLTDLSGSYMSSANVLGGGNDDMLVAGGSSIAVWEGDTNPDNISTPYSINDISAANLNQTSIEDEIILGTDDGIYVLGYPSGHVYDSVSSSDDILRVETAQSYGSELFYNLSAADLIGLHAVYGSNQARFTIPWEILQQDRVCYVGARLNRMGDPRSLNVSVDGAGIGTIGAQVSATQEADYGVTSSGVTDSVAFNEIDEASFDLNSLPLPGSMDDSAARCYIRTPLAKMSAGTYTDLYMTLGGTSYRIDDYEVDSEIQESSVQDHDGSFESALSLTEPRTFTLESSIDAGDDLCYVNTPLGYVGSNENDIVLTINGNDYLLDTDLVTTDNLLDYYSYTQYYDDRYTWEEVDLSSLGVPSDGINAEECVVETGLIMGEEGNLYVEVGSSRYDIDESLVDANRSVEYTVPDAEKVSRFNETHGWISVQTQATFSLIGVVPDDFMAEGDCYIRLGLCWYDHIGGDDRDDLDIRISPDGHRYHIRRNEIDTECDFNDDEAFDWVDVPVYCSDLENDNQMIQVYIEDPDSVHEGYYLMTDSSTNGWNSDYFAGGGSNPESLKYDYLVTVNTDQSLINDMVPVQIDCSDLRSSNDLYYDVVDQGEYWFLRDYYWNYDVRIYSNTSLYYDTVRTQVDCSDIEADNSFEYSCPDCDPESYFRMMRDDDDGDLGVDVTVRSGNHSYTDIEVPCSDIDDHRWLNYTCSGCDDDELFAMYANDNATGNSYYSDGTSRQLLQGGSYKISVFTDESLIADESYVNVDCESLDNGADVVFSCEGCNDTDYFNILQLDLSESTSDYSTDGGGSWDGLSDDLYVKAISYDNMSLPHSVVASDSSGTVNMYDRNLTESWDFQPYNINTLSIGEFDVSVPGPEILVGTSTDVYVLYENGTVLFNGDYNARSSFVGEFNDEIVALFGLNGGDLISCTSDGCTEIYSCSSGIADIAVGDFMYNSGDEIVLLSDNRMYYLSQDFNLIDVIEAAGGNAKELEPARLTQYSSMDSKESLAVLTSSGIHVYDMDYPEDLALLVDDAVSIEVPGGVKSATLDGFSAEMNDYLESCSTNTCDVPISLNDSTGYSRINIDSVDVNFSYDFTGMINFTNDVYKLSKTDDVGVGEDVGYLALEIEYPVADMPVYVRAIERNGANKTSSGFVYAGEDFYFNDALCSPSDRDQDPEPTYYSPTSTGYLGFTYINGTGIGCSRDFYISDLAPTPDSYMWFKNDSTVQPVGLSHEESYTSRYYYYYSYLYRDEGLTSDNITGTVFTISFEDNISELAYTLAVDPYQTGDYQDITPSELNDGCNTANPTYEEITAHGSTYMVCMQDTDGIDGSDFLKIINPVLGPDGSGLDNISYRISVTISEPPYAEVLGVEPSELYWGYPVNYTLNVTDADLDNVSVSVYAKFGSVWSKVAEDNVSTPEIVEIPVQTNRSWISYFAYKAGYYDYNETDALYPEQNTSVSYEPTFIKHSLSIQNRTQNNTVVNIEDTIDEHISVHLVDTTDGTVVQGGVICDLYVGGSYLMSTVADQTGNCTFNLYGRDLGLGDYPWFVRVIDNMYYGNAVSDTFNISFTGGTLGTLSAEIVSPPNETSAIGTAELVVNVTDNQGDPVTDAMTQFNIPAGSCITKVNNQDGTYSCVYEPSRSLKEGYYRWNVSVAKTDYAGSVSDSRYLFISNSLTADIGISPLRLYRFNTTNNLGYHVDDISIYGVPVNNTRVTLYIDGIEVAAYVNQSTVAGSYGVAQDYSMGEHTANITVSSQGYESYSSEVVFEVFGSLNGSLIYPPEGTTVTNREYLRVSVLDGLGSVADTADVTFNTPAGICLATGFNSTYHYCLYEPSSSLGAGSYEWNATLAGDHYAQSITGSRTISIESRITADLELDPRPVDTDFARWNSSENINIVNWTISDIRYNNNPLDDSQLDIYWDGNPVQQYPDIDRDGESSVFGIPADASTGLHELNFTITKPSYESFSDTREIMVKADIVSDLMSPPNNTVFNTTQYMVVNLTDDLGGPVTGADVDFNLPAGDCLDAGNELGGGLYYCNYSASPGLDAGTYRWNVTAEKVGYFDHQSITLNLIRQSVITAQVIMMPDPGSAVYRYDHEEENTNITLIISDVESAAGLIDEWRYSVYWDDLGHGALVSPQYYSEGISSNGSTVVATIDVPDESEIKTDEVVVTINKSGYQDFEESYSYDIMGSMDLVPMVNHTTIYRSGEGENILITIYINDSEPNYNFPLAGVDVRLHVSGDSLPACEETSSSRFRAIGTGIYSCTYDASQYASLGSSNWWVEATKTDYRPASSQNRTVQIRDYVNIGLEMGDVHNRSTNVSVQAQLRDGMSNPIQSDNYLCGFYIDDEHMLTTATGANGSCAYLWETGCSIPGPYNVTVNISEIAPEPHYTWGEMEDSVEAGVYDSMNLTMVMPENSTIYASTGDPIMLNATATDSCGAISSQIANNYIVWEDNWVPSSLVKGLENTYSIPQSYSGSYNVTLYSSYPYYTGVDNTSFGIVLEDFIRMTIIEHQPMVSRSVPENDSHEIKAQIYTGDGGPINTSEFSGNFSGHNCSWYIIQGSDTIFLGQNATDEDGVCRINWSYDCSFTAGQKDVIVALERDKDRLNYSFHPLYGNSSQRSITIHDSAANLGIISPLNGSTHPYRDYITLEAGVRDTCHKSTDPYYNGTGYTIHWSYLDNENISTGIASNRTYDWLLASDAPPYFPITAELDYPGYNITNSTVHVYSTYNSEIPPVISSITMDDEYCYSGQNVSVEVDVSGEGTSTIDYVEAEGQNISFISATRTWTGDVLVDNDGYLNVTVVDLANNTVNGSIEYILDDEPPLVDSFRVVGSTSILNSRDTVEVAANLSDSITISHSGAPSLTDSIANVTVVGAGQYVTLTHVGGSAWSGELNLSMIGYDTSYNGLYDLTLVAFDNAENYNDSAYSVTIDNIPPNVTGKYTLNSSNVHVFSVSGPDNNVKPLPDYPFFIVPRTKNVTWEVNVTDELGQANIRNVSIGSNATLSVFQMSDAGGMTYELLNTTPAAFGAVTGTYAFTADAYDMANNHGNATWYLRVDDNSPVFVGCEATPFVVAQTRMHTQVKVNLTTVAGLGEEDVLELHMISGDGEENIRLMFDKAELSYEGLTPMGAENYVLYHNFTPNATGLYDITAVATNLNSLFTNSTFEDVFRSIGKTSSDLVMSPSLVEIPGLSTVNSEVRSVNITIENVGQVPMYDVELTLTEANGVTHDLGSSSLYIGDIPRDGIRETSVDINFTYRASIGVTRLYAIASWIDADHEVGNEITSSRFDVIDNTWLTIDPDTISDSIYVNESNFLGSLNIYAYGNNKIDGINFSRSSGTLNFSEITLDPDYIDSIPKGSYRRVNVSMSTLDKGPMEGTVIVNATSSNCSNASRCFDTIDFNVTVLDKVDVMYFNPLEDINRSVVEVSCGVRLTRNNATVENYSVEIYDNRSSFYTVEATDSLGISSYTFDATNVTPGSYTFTCAISDDPLNYYEAMISNASETVGIYGSLDLELNLTGNDTIYWYDTQEPYTTSYEAYVQDEVGNPVQGADVRLFSNATFGSAWMEIVACSTGPSGHCNMTWNPTSETTGSYDVVYFAEKPFYHDSQNSTTQINLIGNYSVQIVEPQELEYLTLQNEYDLRIRIVGATGESIDYSNLTSLNWTLDGALIGEEKREVNEWFINISDPQNTRGLHTVRVNVITEDNARFSSDIEIYISDNVSLYSMAASSNEIQRATGNTTLQARVLSRSNASAVEGYNCSWYDSDEVLNHTLTDGDGWCTLEWFPDMYDSVGPHTLRVNISDNLTGYYFAQDPSQLSMQVNLTEGLDVQITSPLDSQMYHRGEYIIYEALVQDEYSAVADAIVNWTIMNSTWQEEMDYGASRYNGSHFLNHVPSPTQHPIGDFIVRSEADKQYYERGNDSVAISIYGYSSVEASETARLRYYVSEDVNLSCRVFDANWSESPIPGYPVTLNFSGNASYSTYQGVSNSTGHVQAAFDLNMTLGDYDFSCIISDNDTLFFTAAPATDNLSLEIWERVNVSGLSASQDSMPRSGGSAILSAQVISVDTRGPIQGYGCNWSQEFHDGSQGYGLGVSTTNQSGHCSIVWHSNQTDTVGPHTVEVRISSVKNESYGYYEAMGLSSQAQVNLTEQLDVNITLPEESRQYRGTLMQMNATVMDAYMDIYTVSGLDSFGWFLSNSSSTIVDIDDSNTYTQWLIPEDFRLGDYFLSANATLGHFTPGEDVMNLSVFSQADVEVTEPTASSHFRRDLLNVECRVRDSANTLPVRQYPVHLMILDRFGSELDSADQTTNSSGHVDWLFDVSALPVGSYMASCNISDEPTLYYDAGVSEATTNMTLYDLLSMNLTASTDVVYRDEGINDTYPYNVSGLLDYDVNLTVNSFDSTPIMNATINLSYTGENEVRIGSCVTGASGTCSILWDVPDTVPAGPADINVTASHRFYNTTEMRITDVFAVRVRSMPTWNEPFGTVIVDTSEDMEVTVNCSVRESATGRPIQGTAHGISHFYMEPGYLKNRTYLGSRVNFTTETGETGHEDITWDVESGSGSILGFNISTTGALQVETNDSFQDLQGYELLTVTINSSSANAEWNLSYYNRSSYSWDTVIPYTQQDTAEVNVEEENIDNIRLGIRSTDAQPASVVLEHVLLEKASYDSVTEIGGTDVFGDIGPTLGHYRGDMEAIENERLVQPYGWHYSCDGDCNASRSDGEVMHGSSSLLLNISSLQPGEDARLIWELEDQYNIMSYKRMTFWVYSDNPDLLIIFNMTNEAEDSFELSLGNFTGWRYRQPLIAPMTLDVSDIDRLEFKVINNRSTEQSGNIYVDEVRLMNHSYADSEGHSVIEWMVPYGGYFLGMCNITDEGYYNTSQTQDRKNFRITDINEDDEPGSGDDVIGGTPGELDYAMYVDNIDVTSFAVDSFRYDYIMANGTHGKGHEVMIDSFLDSDIIMRINAFSGVLSLDPGHSRQQMSVVLPARESVSVPIYFNATEADPSYRDSELDYLQILSASTGEAITIELNVTVRNLSVDVTYPLSQCTGIREGDPLSVVANISVDGNGSYQATEGLSYIVHIGDAAAEQVALSYNYTWNTTVEAPLPPGNPLVSDIMFTASLEGLTSGTTVGMGNDSQVLPGLAGYVDVTAPEISWVNSSITGALAPVDIDAGITDNSGSMSAWMELAEPYSLQQLSGFNGNETVVTGGDGILSLTLPASSTVYRAGFNIIPEEGNPENLTIRVGDREAWSYEGSTADITGSGSLQSNEPGSTGSAIYVDVPMGSNVSAVNVTLSPAMERLDMGFPYAIEAVGSSLYIMDMASRVIVETDGSMSSCSDVIGTAREGVAVSYQRPIDIDVQHDGPISVLDLADMSVHDMGSNGTATVLDGPILDYPRRIAHSNNSGGYFVIDKRGNDMHVYDSSLSYVRSFGECYYPLRDEYHNLSNPTDVAFNGSSIYVLNDRAAGSVYVFDEFNGSDYNIAEKLDIFEDISYNFSNPKSIDIHDDVLFVSDFNNRRVLGYNISDSHELVYIINVTGRPTDIAVDGDVHVIDFDTRRISTYSLGGDQLSVRDSLCSFYPYDVHLDALGDSYVSTMGELVNNEFRQSGELDSQLELGLSGKAVRKINEHISTCSGYQDIEGNWLCRVPFHINMTGPGSMAVTVDMDLQPVLDVSGIADQITQYIMDTGNSTVVLNITYGGGGELDITNLSVIYSRGYSNHSMSNISASVWRSSPGVLNMTGEYLAHVFARDPDANMGSASRFIMNYPLVGIYSRFLEEGSGITGEVILMSNLTGEHTFTYPVDDTTVVDSEIYENHYDVLFDLEMPVAAGTYGVDIRMESVSFSRRNTTHIVDPVRVNIIDHFNLTLPDDVEGHPELGSTCYGGFSVKEDVGSFSHSDITVHYSHILDTISGYDPGNPFYPDEENLFMLRCPWYDASNCTADDWERVEARTSDDANDVFRTTVGSMSSFVLVEVNRSADPVEIPEPRPSQTSSSSSSSSGGGAAASGGSKPLYCGDGICSPSNDENSTSCPEDCLNATLIFDTCGNGACELGENIGNCPEDCKKESSNVRLLFNDIQVYPGQSKEYQAIIDNPENVSREIRISFDEENIERILSLMSDTVTIPAGGSERVKIMANAHEDEVPAIYYGNMIIQAGLRRHAIPLTVVVSDYSNIPFKLDVETVAEQVVLGDTLKIRVNIFDSVLQSNALKVEYFIREFDSDNLVKNLTEYIDPQLTTNFIKEIDLRDPRSTVANATLPEGKYIVEVIVSDVNYNAFASEAFTVYYPILTPQRVRAISLLSIITFIALVAYYASRKYRQWKIEHMRYIQPDFSRLPRRKKDSFWLGKIPESTKRSYFHPSDMTTHVLVAGSTGSGKSVTASIFVEEALMKNIPAVIFDPTSQWTGFVRQCKDKNLLRFYKEFGFSEDDSKSFKGLIYNVADPDFNIRFKSFMNPGEVTVFNMHSLKPEEYDTAVRNIIDKIFKESWEESQDLKLLLVFDEVHRLLEKYGGKGGYVSLEKACREFRKWGIGLVMVSQVSADFKEAVSGNILTDIQMNTKSMEDIKKIAHKYGTNYSSKVTRQGIGIAMVQNPAYNNGKPWFVHMRPTLHSPHKIPDDDLERYTEYSKRLDRIEAVLKAAKKGGENVDDILLELRLTRDKLKEGHFKMVEIYQGSLQVSMSHIPNLKKYEAMVKEQDGKK